MKRITSLLTLILITTNIVISQNSKFSHQSNKSSFTGYEITGEIDGLVDTSIILAYYFGDKQYARDTAYSKSGKFTFSGDKKLDGGMYLIVLPNQKYFDLIITEQKFSFKSKISNLVSNMSFSNSEENTPFYNYLNFIVEKQKQVAPLKSKIANANKDEKEKLLVKQKNIDNEVTKYRDEFLFKYSKIFFAKILIASIDPIIPTSPLDSLGNKDESFPFKYYKKHFWDNIDFSDKRILKTRMFLPKMEQYLDKMTAKIPDSIIVSAEVLIKNSTSNDEVFKYVVSHITSTYERSKIMGMDAVFVHMVEKYYMTNKCSWVDSTQLSKIIERAEKISPNLIGKVAPEFIDYYGKPFMKDPDGKAHALQSLKAKYTLLVFYGPTCGHCKKELPKIKNSLDSLIILGADIKTYAVATEFDIDEWRKFIVDQQTQDWLNVADISFDNEGNPLANSDWRDKYDIYSTPVIYLLDKEKRILAKRINNTQLVEIITRIESL